MTLQPQSLSDYVAAVKAVALTAFDIDYGDCGDECWREHFENGMPPHDAVADDISNL